MASHDKASDAHASPIEISLMLQHRTRSRLSGQSEGIHFANKVGGGYGGRRWAVYKLATVTGLSFASDPSIRFQDGDGGQQAHHLRLHDPVMGATPAVDCHTSSSR